MDRENSDFGVSISVYGRYFIEPKQNGAGAGAYK